jgi:hypothetical protein
MLRILLEPVDLTLKAHPKYRTPLPAGKHAFHATVRMAPRLFQRTTPDASMQPALVVINQDPREKSAGKTRPTATMSRLLPD